MTCAEICRELLEDCKARCVFLVDYCDRELVTLGDVSLDDAKRLVAAMQTEVDPERSQIFHVSPSLGAIRHPFESGGYILVLFEPIHKVGVVGVQTKIAARKLAPFVEPPHPRKSH